MNLKHSTYAVAGDEFTAEVDDFQGTLNLRIYAGEQELLHETCPREPCKKTVTVPIDSTGEYLRILMSDDKEEKMQRVQIIATRMAPEGRDGVGGLGKKSE